MAPLSQNAFVVSFLSIPSLENNFIFFQDFFYCFKMIFKALKQILYDMGFFPPKVRNLVNKPRPGYAGVSLSQG